MLPRAPHNLQETPKWSPSSFKRLPAGCREAPQNARKRLCDDVGNVCTYNFRIHGGPGAASTQEGTPHAPAPLRKRRFGGAESRNV
eukprot:6843866-Pyramimonas_sp.AAC.1